MNQEPQRRFIYVTPYLTEVKRIQESTNFDMYQPLHGSSGKMNDLHKLLARGVNIVTTHALFREIDYTGIRLLRNSGYTLILDEALDVIEPIHT